MPSLADLGAPPPPYDPKLSQFHAVFWKFWQNRILARTPTGNPGSTPGLGYLKLLSSNLMTNKIQMFETEIKLSSRKICPGPGSYSLDLDLSRDRSRVFDLQSVLSSSLFSLDQNIIIDLLTYYKILHHRFLHVFRIIVFFSSMQESC